MGEVMDALYSPDDQYQLEPRMCPVAPLRVCQVSAGLIRLHDQMREWLARQTLASIVGCSCSKETMFDDSEGGYPAGELSREPAAATSSRHCLNK